MFFSLRLVRTSARVRVGWQRTFFFTRVTVLAIIFLALWILSTVSVKAENPSSPATESPLAGAVYVENQLIIKFAPGVQDSGKRELRSTSNSVILRELSLIGAELVQISGMTVEEAIGLYKDDTRIQYVEPNYVCHADIIPNDPYFNLLWGMHNTGQTGGTVDADIDAVEAWNISTGDSVIIGVIDTGVDTAHVDLLGNIWTNPGEIPNNGIDDDGNGYVDDIHGWDFVNWDNGPIDDNGHGTHCSGTIAAVGNNAIGVAGVCWSARIMALKFLDAGGYGYTSDAILALQYATMMGANLTSNSWGGGGYSQALKDAIDSSGAYGMLFVAAAGNDQENNDIYPHYPCSYDLDNIIAVAATDHNDNLAYFSNWGLVSVDLGAPGVDIYSSLPGNSYGYGSGTSMACPHVSGACALVWSEYPGLTHLQVKNRIMNMVDPVPSLAGKCVSGGRLNAFMSIAEPESIPPSPISDLTVIKTEGSKITLSWTATGDDTSTGTASYYDVRYSLSLIDSNNFDLATQVIGEPEPKPAGSPETLVVRGLNFNTTYYFAIKAFDEWSNPSGVSNSPWGTTLGPPDISVSPDSLRDSLFTGEKSTQVLTISNTGVSDLTFDISIEEAETSVVKIATGYPEADNLQGRTDRILTGVERTSGDFTSSKLTIWEANGIEESTYIQLSNKPLENKSQENQSLLQSFDHRVVSRSAPTASFFVETIEDFDTEATWPWPPWVTVYGGGFVTSDCAHDGPQGIKDPDWHYRTDVTVGFPKEKLWMWVKPGFGRCYMGFGATSSGAWSLVAAPNSGELIIQRNFNYSFQDLASVSQSWSSGTWYKLEVTFEDTNLVTGRLYGPDGTTLLNTVSAILSGFQPSGVAIRSFSDFCEDTFEKKARFIWLSASPTSDTIPAGSSLDIAVTFDAKGLDGGDYNANIVISSNDPDEPKDTVKAYLHVTGAPDIATDLDTLSFGIVYIGYPETLPLLVSNEGTDSLRVTNIVLDLPEFSVDLTNFVLAPGEDTVVNVSFAPTFVGEVWGNLTISSDDPDEPTLMVTLRGEGLICPDIWVDPPSVLDSLFTGETSVETLTVGNSGGSPLYFKVELDNFVGPTAMKGVSSGRAVTLYKGSSSLSDLLGDKGVRKIDYDPDAKTTAGLYEFGQDGFSNISANPGDVLASWPAPSPIQGPWGLGFDGHEVWVSDYMGITDNEVSTAGVLLSWFSCSGWVGVWPADMDWDGNYIWQVNVGGDNGIYKLDPANGNVLSSIHDPSHTWDAVSQRGLAYDRKKDVFYIGGWNQDRVYKIKGPSWDHPGEILSFFDFPNISGLAWHPAGTLWIAVNASTDYIFQVNPETGSIISQFLAPGTGGGYEGAGLAIDKRGNLWCTSQSTHMVYLVESGVPAYQWLAVTPEACTLGVGETKKLEVRFDATGLFGGNYSADILIQSNDCDQPVLTVPALLHVTGAPDIAVLEDTLDYGIVFIGASVTDTLVVSNEGTDLLTVSDIFSDHPDYTIDTTNFSLDPEKSQKVLVTFSPSDTGEILGLLTIRSNDPDDSTVTVFLRGEGLIPPDIAVSPDSLRDSLFTGETSTQILTIDNSAGGSDLTFEITHLPVAQSISVPERQAFSPTPTSYIGSFEMFQEEVRSSNTQLRKTYGRVSGQGIDVFVLSSSSYSPGADTLVARLAKFDDIGLVTLFDAGVGTPTTSEMLEYDVVVMTTDQYYADMDAACDNVASYIDSGGKVILTTFCWANQGNNTIRGRLLNDYSPFQISGFSLYSWADLGTYASEHPIFQGVSTLHAYFRDDVSLSSGASLLATWNDDHLFVAEKGNAVAINTALHTPYPVYSDGWTGDGWILLHNTVVYLIRGSWLTYSPRSGTISAGNSMNIEVTFDATGLNGGDYNANIMISSNDPDEPKVTVPAHLHVTGAPDIAVDPDSLDFGTVYIGYPESLPLLVSNKGTDILTVTDIAANVAEFSVDLTNFVLAPGKDTMVNVTFAPTAVGEVWGSLSISSNDPDEPVVNVALRGEGLYPPSITVTPDSFVVAVNESDSTTDTMTIGNVGLGDLVWEILGLSEASKLYTLPSATINTSDPDIDKQKSLTVLQSNAIVSGENKQIKPITALLSDLTGKRIGITWVSGYSTIIADLQARGAIVREVTFPITPAILDSLDILAVDDGFGSASSSDITAIRTWLQSGKAILLQGDDWSIPNNNSILSGTGISEVSLGGYYSAILTNILPHPTTVGVDTIYAGAYGAYCVVNSPAQTIVFDDMSRPHIAVSMLGAGRIIAVGNEVCDDYNLGVGDTRLFANQVFDWLATGGFLSVSPTSGTVAPGLTQDVTVKFNAKHLIGGDYSANIAIDSNDPVNNPKNVPVHLHVIGVPNIVVAPDSIDFGSAFIGFGKTDTLRVKNTGSETLNVSSIMSNKIVFSANPTTFSVPPFGGEQRVTVTFMPNDTGLFTGDLTIASDDPDEPSLTVPLRGVGLIPPDISVYPDSLQDSLFTGEKSTDTLIISNTGFSDLSFEISIEGVATTSVSSLSISTVENTVLNQPPSFSDSYDKNSDKGKHPSFNVKEIRSKVASRRSNLTASRTGGVPLIAITNAASSNAEIYENPQIETTLTDLGYDYIYIGSVSEAETAGADAILGRFGGIDLNLTELTAWIESRHGYIQNGDWIDWFPDSWTWIGSTPIEVNILDSSHPIAKGLPATWTANGFWHYAGWGYIGWVTDTAFSNVGQGIVSGITYDRVITANQIGDGYAVYLGFNIYGSEAGTESIQLFANALKWVTGGGTSWLSVDPTSGIIPAGDSVDIEVTFDATGLNGGDYRANIVIYSNDPDEPEDTVPAHLHVTGAPDIVISEDTLDYGNVFIGASVIDTFIVSNEGTDLLTVSNISSDNPDYTVDTTSFALNPKESHKVLVAFVPSKAGAITGTLTIASNDPDEPTLTVVLRGEGIVPPDIAISPDSLSDVLIIGESSVDILTIDNTGGSDLRFQIEMSEQHVSRESEPAVKGYDSSYYGANLVKGENDFRVGSPIHFNSGGPDSFGYQWRDSDDPGGPEFVWEEISGIGTQITGLGDDDNVGPFNLGFPFSFYFYGNEFNSIYFCTNGWLSFTSTLTQFWNEPLPSQFAPENLVAPFWDDLNFYIGGSAYYYNDGAKFIVEYKEVYHIAGGGPYTFEVILYPNGRILYQYLSMGMPVDGSTVGIQNADKTIGLEIAFNTSYIHDSLAVLIYKGVDWLECSPVSGTIPPLDSQTISATFEAPDTSGVDYFAELVIVSNDPDESEVTVPVHMRVVAIGDVNADFKINLSDVIYLANYLLKGGPAPKSLLSADVFCDSHIDLTDVIWLANYLIKGWTICEPH